MTTDDSALFIDTNVLVYASRPASPWHTLANDALDAARQQGVALVISPQIVREYLVAVTRPSPDGSNTSLADALANVASFRTTCRVVEENQVVVSTLESLLSQVTVLGSQIHDANIVATMQTHNIRRVLTHNTQDFARFAHVIRVTPLEPPTPTS